MTRVQEFLKEKLREGSSGDVLRATYSCFSEEEKNEYRDLFLEYVFQPKNKLEDDEILISPCNKYKLNISYYKTLKGSWCYSRGEVYDSFGKKICDIKRNYSNFWYSWITSNNGKDYLLCGEDYQGVTFVNLETGEKKSWLTDKFCWQSAELIKELNILHVEGCYWGGGSEHKFYDFSNPEEDFKEIKIYKNGKESELYEVEGKPLEFKNGLIEVFKNYESYSFKSDLEITGFNNSIEFFYQLLEKVEKWYPEDREDENDFYYVFGSEKYKLEDGKIVFVEENLDPLQTEINSINRERSERNRIKKEAFETSSEGFRLFTEKSLEFGKKPFRSIFYETNDLSYRINIEKKICGKFVSNIIEWNTVNGRVQVMQNWKIKAMYSADFEKNNINDGFDKLKEILMEADGNYSEF